VGGTRRREGPARPERLSDIRRDGFRERGLQVTRLETFVDAAFAFAVTLMVIAAGERPDSYAELHEALRRVPTFLGCFLLIISFWASHERFSRRFGLEDRTTVTLSLALVAGVLVWMYPLRMVLSSGFWFMSGGWVPSELQIHALDELMSAFRIFAVGFAGLNLNLLLLNRHALRQADVLGLDARERLETGAEVERHAIDIGAAAISVGVTFLVAGSTTEWVLGLPGFAYGLLGIAFPLHYRRLRRQRAALG
jgi:hypothetical protein